MDQPDFLHYIFGESRGYLEVATRNGLEYAPYPLPAPLIGSDLRFRPVLLPVPGYDVEDNGITTSVVPVDIDPRSPLSVPPSIRLVTGEGDVHTSGGYRLSSEVSYSELRALHRKLDPLGQLPEYLPLPDTTTTKWGDSLDVRVERQPSFRTWTLQEIRRIEPFLAAPDVLPADLVWSPPAEQVGTGVQFYLATRLESAVASRIGRLVDAGEPKLDQLIGALLDQQFSLREIIWVASKSDHPFRRLAYDAVWELARYIARQAATVTAPASQAIARIRQLRGMGGKPQDRMDAISHYVLTDMEQRGTFLHQTDNTYWYVDAETGEPIELSRGSERMHILLSHRYGLNGTTQEHNHAADTLIPHTGMLPKTAVKAQLSYYRAGGSAHRGGDTRDNGQLFVHFGGRDIGVLTADGLSAVRNGEPGLIFHLPGQTDPVVTTSLRTDVKNDWWDEFLPASYFRALEGMEPHIASALLRVWAQFVLFREEAPSRPLVALLGSPGSGKSTLGRRLYALFYGGRRELTAIDGPSQFNTSTSNAPFVIFDNVDRCPPWLPAFLELSITPRDQEKRKLFTDNTVYLMRCDAIVGITAHDATIFREGIFDRMLVLNFRRLKDSEKIPESRLDRWVVDNRENFLSGLLSDACRILQTPRPEDPTRDWDNKLRIMDFVDMGAWFAEALGILPEFKSAVSTIKVRQSGLILEGESGLVDALEKYALEDPIRAREWHTASSLLSRLQDHCDDDATFAMLYKTAPVLGAKLSSIYAQLHDSVGLELFEDKRSARRSWRIIPPAINNEED